jgi:diguanylate cyclase (GGDEF)-like protein/putative nucleotidyltransferase with HDIG domain
LADALNERSHARALARGHDGDAASLIEAGQAAERSGQRAEARALFEHALNRLEGGASEHQAASVLRWIARTYMTDGDPEAALDCAEAALAVAQAFGDRAAEGHAVNVQAAIRWAQGDLDAAEPLFLAARTIALSVGERALVAMTSHNLGIIANIRGDFDEALHHYSVGLENYRALDRRQDVIAALNNMGRLHTDLRRWTEAERAYTEAIETAKAVGDQSARVGLEVNVAELGLSRGDAIRASAALDRATSLGRETGDSAWEANIAKLRGILQRDAGAVRDAEQSFARAVELSEARQDLLLLAETLRERAELYQREGRNRETLQNLNRAHRLFTQLRAKHELANVDRSVARLEGGFLDVVRRWGESIEAKDRYTQGHCVRVADLSCAVAVECGIDGQSLFWFRIGALLHDVGKLVVPSEVLNKPGKLSEDEWALMRSHPTAGVDMLAGIDFPWDVRPIIESHHERWDGTGYPHGLRGEEIPLSARILTVADVYDALTSVRSYKHALSHSEAMDIMRRDAGFAFDPAVFTKFEEVVGAGHTTEGASERAAAATFGSGPTPVTLEVTSDGVTGLPTRRSMERITAQVLADRRATNGTVSMLVLQLESAAAWSDVQHRRVLRWIARELRAVTRTSDFVARTADDQFMALFANSSETQARSIMARVERALIRRLQQRSVASASAQLRMAVVTSPREGETADELFASAAQAAAKSSSVRRSARAG